MPVLKPFKVQNTWETICKGKRPGFWLSSSVGLGLSTVLFATDFENRRVLADKKNAKEISDFDPAKHSPVFYGHSFAFVKVDDDRLLSYDPAISHPACVGFTVEPYRGLPATPARPKNAVNRNKCSEREYLEAFVFPTLLPALERMLEEAKRNKCFEVSRLPTSCVGA